jgi:hypothetical protein
MPFDALVYIIGEEPLYLRGSFSFMAGADGEREIQVLGYPISQLRLLCNHRSYLGEQLPALLLPA